MKKIFAKFLSAFLLDKERRRAFRSWMMNIGLQNLYYAVKFFFLKIRPNSVLLLEINDTHGEVLGGYLQYFQRLNFNVDILMKPTVLNEKPFCRLHMGAARIFACGNVMMKKILASSKLLGYRHIIVMTSADYVHRRQETYSATLENYSELLKHPSLFVVEHELNDIERFGEKKLLEQKRLITLGHFEKTVFASPILFGDIRITNKNDLTKFICVGSIQSARKNHRLLIEAVSVVAGKHKNFKVVIIGKGKLEDFPKNLRPYIEITGRLNFPRMFRQMENADFYLPLLDAENVAHNRYITTGVTGSAQLIYAFAKIPIIHPHFAAFYEFDTANAIVTENLAEGMLQAIEMSTDSYVAKQKNLLFLAKRLEDKTMNNLKELLK